MQGEQLLPECKVFEDEIFTRAEANENPAKEMTERNDHERKSYWKTSDRAFPCP
jgi:hypothetical protein